LFLWAYYPFRTRDGEVFAWMITVYPVMRILEEFIRTDEPEQWDTGLSISQLLSLGVLALAGFVWVYIHRRAPGSVLPPKTPAEKDSLLSAAK
jgi:prolipoprotein diacylglyceryltransferase